MYDDSQIQSNLKLFFFIGCLLMGGCAPHTYYVSILTDFDLERPTSRTIQIPLRAGLYIEPKYCEFETVLRNDTIISVGDGFSKGAEKVLRQAFHEVVVIDSQGPETNDQDIEIKVTFRVVHMSLLPTSSRIAFEWTMLGRDGRTLYLNTFLGEAGTKNMPESDSEGYEMWLSERFSLAAKGSFQRFLTHILSSRWWRSR